jgi:hypothetical protein
MSPVGVQAILHAFGFRTLELYWQLWKLPYFPPHETHFLCKINPQITPSLNSGTRKLFNSGASLTLAASNEAGRTIFINSLVASFICLPRFQFLSRVSRQSKLSRAVFLTLWKPHSLSNNCISVGWLSYLRVYLTISSASCLFLSIQRERPNSTPHDVVKHYRFTISRHVTLKTPVFYPTVHPCAWFCWLNLKLFF